VLKNRIEKVLKVFHYIIIILFLHMFCKSQTINAQDTHAVPVPVKKKYTLIPQKATMLSAVFPGMGQVYNRKYWKLPIVYAGFGALGYSLTFYTTRYNRYIKAFQDFDDKIPETSSYLEVVKSIEPKNYDPVLYPDTYNASSKEAAKDQLLAGIDYYRKYRDLSFIGIGAWYVLSIIDANVDASMFDYDIDNNLNLTFSPFPVNVGNYLITGVKVELKINF
jgi:hypothetical protein